MNESAGLVSIVIPAYNAAWCVGRAIDSALVQTYPACEIVVVDDGSTDETPALLAGYGGAIRVTRTVNGGMSSARNEGIRQARGEFVAFLDADDWWLPSKIAAQVELMRRCPEIGFCSVAARVVDPQGRLINIWTCPQSDGSLLPVLFRQTAAVAGASSGVLVRGALLGQVGPFDESLRGSEDTDMWMRLAAAGGFACIKDPLAVILKRPDSVSRNLKDMREGAIRVMQKNRALLPTEQRGAHWRAGMAGVFTDYAKWQYRVGQRSAALMDVLRAFLLAPYACGRLCLGLLKDMALGRRL